MKNPLQIFLPTALVVSLPLPAFAQAPNIPPTVLKFVGKISTEILNPLIALMFAVALLVFIWGVARYIWSPDDPGLRESGRKSMLWGIIGMVIMVSVFGIMRFIISSIGADPGLLNYV
jgi:hypothetical protein